MFYSQMGLIVKKNDEMKEGRRGKSVTLHYEDNIPLSTLNSNERDSREACSLSYLIDHMPLAFVAHKLNCFSLRETVSPGVLIIKLIA